MKIAVYTIALNEEQFVNRWYESAKEADYLLIADTGSTDKTVELAKSLGIVCHTITVKPWRFDDARNAALALLPADIDYCVSLDMDEILRPGWRQELKKTTVTRPRYIYNWNFNEDGTPATTFAGDHIHKRTGYRWIYPVHEVLVPDRIEETQESLNNLFIDHKADQTKSRGQYLGLLALSVKEDPNNDRNAFYYARELYFYNKYPEAIDEFNRYLGLPNAVWAAERAAAMRYIAMMTEDVDAKETWLRKAIDTAPDRREAYIQLAELFYNKGMWTSCADVAELALGITEKPLEYLCESWAWNERPYDYVAFCSYKLAMSEKKYQKESGDDRSEHINHYLDKAIKFGAKAVELNPNDTRLKSNLQFYLEEQGGNDNL